MKIPGSAHASPTKAAPKKMKIGSTHPSTAPTADDEALLREETMNLRAQLEDRNQALESAHSEQGELAMENSELRRQLDETNVRLGELSNRPTGFEGIAGVSSSAGNGEIVVTIQNDILFDSGQATLKQSAKDCLT